jgi:hypothetical protein
METLTYQKEVKAIKEHSCNFCGTKINIGEAYMKSTHKHDGDVYDWKTHKYCAEIAERLKMYDDADEGVTMDDFMETIHCKHDDLLIDQLPFDKEQPQKFSDIIQQLRHVKFKDKLWYVIRYYKKLDKDEETKPCA